jgi:hypothetical protein
MRILLTVGAIAMSAGLTGCLCMSHGKGIETPACGATIAIVYKTDGTPSANPDACQVISGAELTWQTPVGDNRPFTLELTHGPVSDRDDRSSLPSHSNNGRQSVNVLIKSVVVETTVKYGIQANGKSIDPALIIHPAN